MSHVTGYESCFCGKTAVIRTSWTDDNPGRRFQSCLNFKRGGCQFFSWEDPPMCNRARQIIPGLLRKINKIQDELEKMKDKNARLVLLQEEVGKLKS
ncbi:hypothetical protein DH2020_027264 [Rehmannia glutinosa]|uniref:GRF-type domain-containing protein n=1 Tax=Rehmannia glutinosa TaxID=99300 RepID=A0ABR0VY99_REHGL